MNYSKPKKVNFNSDVSLTIRRISDRLDGSCAVETFPTSITLFQVNDWKRIKHIIKETVKEIFGCDKASEYCKLNKLDDKVFIRFKRVL